MAAPARGAAGGANQVSDESSSTSAHAPQVRASQTDATRLKEKYQGMPSMPPEEFGTRLANEAGGAVGGITR